MTETVALNTIQFVVFVLSDEEYGLDIQIVNTIEKMIPITRVPKTPKFIKGVINLRGDIVPIMDLKERFGLPQIEETEETRIIIVKFEDVQMGIIVDEVKEVIYINEEQIESTTSLAKEGLMENVLGAGKVDNRVITLLNIEKLVNISVKE
ncbi:chemotaxis protein CheW [Pseudobacteroides cellulosolvens]|uniref:Chemotaxis protein CheW n=1 Tax=Pseudobacteroides cellulosolvens ATCC 35603 = DSM 2933 TaxID=398512 RepID=A0A0L6JRF1_9FIRM|nr:chemotaxis protein CheW [Pseudobacteroides cellulosolvens]KNY28358.1 CheW protein [Pseudobacteroides cellulosolvens ATCC 35603 = DSM 2933]